MLLLLLLGLVMRSRVLTFGLLMATYSTNYRRISSQSFHGDQGHSTWRPRPLNMATKAIMGSMSHNSLHSLNMEDDEYSLNMEDDDNSMSLTGGIKKSVAFMEKFHEDLDAFYRLDDEERQLLIDLKYLTLSPASQKPKEKDVVIVISDDEEEKHVLMNLKYLASSSTSKKPEGADVVIGISDEEEKMALQPSSPKKTLPMAGQTKERRFHRKWTKEEEEALRHGYKKYKTNWKLILGDPAYKACHGRTNVDLKDKWRNLMRADDRAKAKACYSLPNGIDGT
ncbi:uncharacterized protein LOC112197496 isoform X2 [Rosa chinensis]|uniref:uncharacterized protein LOC112197496 isoform X2 n=1 Tax=Rosa chinensis TaxID=74649 RepID=UPI000D088AA9|nr:uncharacterized protein LOC112197496 isoform X2 [Rosa chinensis]